MGLVTDIYWECPGCGNKNTAQLYGQLSDPNDFPRTAVPIARSGDLKWNPPCGGCGEYKLSEPIGVVEMPIVSIEDDET